MDGIFGKRILVYHKHRGLSIDLSGWIWCRPRPARLSAGCGTSQAARHALHYIDPEERLRVYMAIETLS